MTAFITRALSPTSDFRRLLEQHGWRVEGYSLVRLTPLPMPLLPAADWIFFASGNAVRFFFQQLDASEQPLPEVQWAAIGPATAELLGARVEKIDFCGTGDPSTTARNFAGRASGRTVLFPGARHSSRSIPDLLAGTIRAILLDLYDNQPHPDPPRRDDDLLAFTSPMNVRAYFDRHLLQPHQRLLAIGTTTAAALHELGFHQAVVAPEPSELGLARAALALPA